MTRSHLIAFAIWLVATTFMICMLMSNDKGLLRRIEILECRIKTLQDAAGLEWGGEK